jgi:hypothetical protein
MEFTSIFSTFNQPAASHVVFQEPPSELCAEEVHDAQTHLRILSVKCKPRPYYVRGRLHELLIPQIPFAIRSIPLSDPTLIPVRDGWYRKHSALASDNSSVQPNAETMFLR